jgi:PKD repeat protein
MKKTNHLLHILLAAVITLTSLAGTVSTGSAQEDGGLSINIQADNTCGDVEFSVSWTPVETNSYLFYMDFGDGDTTSLIPTEESSLTISHTYTNQGDYELYVEVVEADFDGLSGTASQSLVLEGPGVTLNSQPFPPMFINGDDGQVDFSVEVFGGTPDYSYQWDLNGDGNPEPYNGNSASYTYSEVGEYTAQVTVTDNCGFTGSDSMPVVVAEEDDVCHPMAQKIADGISSLLPEQKAAEYSCEDIYSLFDNEDGQNNLGFGRMWMAYKLADTIDLTWEEILAWHLDESGWGTLLQLNRFADLLEEHSIADLVGLVMSEDYTMNNVRTAVRSATRYEADFEDALARAADGANPGELSQFYKLAADLEVEPEVLDTYLADGMTLPELKHAANFADKMEVDWTEIADLRTDAESWGSINQAYRLANEDVSAAEILTLGVNEYRESLREEKKAETQEKQTQNKEEKNQQTAEKLAKQFSAEVGDVTNLLNGECEGDWACVRSELREQSRTTAEGLSEKDYQTAMQIAAKYGSSEDAVLAYHQETCQMDWSCTRAYFRNMYMETRETGKSKK